MPSLIQIKLDCFLAHAKYRLKKQWLADWKQRADAMSRCLHHYIIAQLRRSTGRMDMWSLLMCCVYSFLHNISSCFHENSIHSCGYNSSSSVWCVSSHGFNNNNFLLKVVRHLSFHLTKHNSCSPAESDRVACWVSIRQYTAQQRRYHMRETQKKTHAKRDHQLYP